MQPYIDHINSFTVLLEYLTGDTLRIAPWEVKAVQEDNDKWTAIRENTEAYEAIKTDELNQQSRRLYAKHHHWGTFVVNKKRECPFKTE
jgi:hypothetical protein